MKYTKEILEKYEMSVLFTTDSNTFSPKLIIETGYGSFSIFVSRVQIEDLKLTGLSFDEIYDNLIDNFLCSHPELLRKIKLEKIKKIVNEKE